MYRPEYQTADIFTSFWEKLAAMLQSGRFIAAVTAAVVTLWGPTLGLDPELAQSIVTALIAAIVGDSIRPMEELLKSRRFWVLIASVLIAVLSQLGVGIDPSAVQQIVLAVAAWVVGDSWRVTLKRQ